MIFSYDKTSKTIKLPEETEIEKHHILERQDLEKWVEDYPQILGEELLVITTEYDKFNKTDDRLDLLALDHDGNLVVVELKRTDSGRNVELQALKYAAYCSTMTLEEVTDAFRKHEDREGKNITEEEARKRIKDFITNDQFEEINDRPRIMLVAKEFQPEVTASVLWLRKFGVDISCIKIVPYESDDSLLFESSILIPLPEAENYIVRTERKEDPERNLTLTQEEYLNFFTEVGNRTASRIPIRLPSPGGRSFYSLPTGTGGIHYEWIFSGRPRQRLNVDLHLEKQDHETNLRVLELMKPAIERLEKRLGTKVEMYPIWGRVWARFGISNNEASVLNEALKKWAVDTMVVFYEVIQPEIDKLKEKDNI